MWSGSWIRWMSWIQHDPLLELSAASGFDCITMSQITALLKLGFRIRNVFRSEKSDSGIPRKPSEIREPPHSCSDRRNQCSLKTLSSFIFHPIRLSYPFSLLTYPRYQIFNNKYSWIYIYYLVEVVGILPASLSAIEMFNKCPIISSVWISFSSLNIHAGGTTRLIALFRLIFFDISTINYCGS